MTVARTGKDKVRAWKIARHESKSQKSKNCCLRGKEKVTGKGQLPEQETKEKLPEQEKIMSEAFRTVARI
jgi:hypothetical protein